jgi:hypothetical protein
MHGAAAAKLEKLIEHGKKTAWDPAHDVDWAESKELDRLSSEEREALRSVLSLVYYSDAQGREILAAMCRALDKRGGAGLPLGDKAHEFFLQQIGDEDRHASGIMMLLKRLGLEPEEKTISHKFYSKILLAEGLFDAKLVLIYWYIEILAKGIFVELKKRFPATCVDSLFTRIIRDEARHVGFGELYIPVHAAQASASGAGGMALAYYSSAAALPGLYRFTHYARAARTLKLDVRAMFTEGMSEISAKVRRLPPAAGRGFVDLKRPSELLSVLL